MIPFVQFRIRRFSWLDLIERVDSWFSHLLLRLMSMDDAEILRDQLFIVQDFAGRAGEHTASGVEDDRLIRNVER